MHKAHLKDNLMFFGQRIVNLSGRGADEYELLLRGSNGTFPAKLYCELFDDDELHTEYIEFLEEIIIKILNDNKDYIFSLNFDHQDLEYPETIEFLECIDPKLRLQLKIELTEAVPNRRANLYLETIDVDKIRKISELGYRISFDDIEVGLNSIGNLIKVKDYISRVKWSYLHFSNHLTENNLKKMILFLASVTEGFKMEFVIEGIESQQVVNWLTKENIAFQQGFYYSRPEDIKTIKKWHL